MRSMCQARGTYVAARRPAAAAAAAADAHNSAIIVKPLNAAMQPVCFAWSLLLAVAPLPPPYQQRRWTFPTIYFFSFFNMSYIYLHKMRYPMQQTNGQRITGPCDLLQNFQPTGFELWVTNIPRDMYEETLLPIFARVGVIYQFRLMMNFSGQNRGFGYLMYAHHEDAKRAIDAFNLFEVQPGTRLQVRRSYNLCRLVLGGMRPEMHPDDIYANVMRMAADVQKMEVLTHGAFQYATVTFGSHRAAAMARRAIVQEMPVFGPSSWINWDN